MVLVLIVKLIRWSRLSERYLTHGMRKNINICRYYFVSISNMSDRDTKVERNFFGKARFFFFFYISHDSMNCEPDYAGNFFKNEIEGNFPDMKPLCKQNKLKKTANEITFTYISETVRFSSNTPLVSCRLLTSSTT